MSDYSTHANYVVDLTSTPPPLIAYVFLALTGTATISGYFVNMHGRQEGASFTGTVGAAVKTFKDLSGAAVPTAATGFVGRITGANVSFGLGGNPDGTPGAYTPDATYPILSMGDYVALGRVG
ncbi:hypothetical protein CCAX7_53940 [Capsulimonas corticalis]|uniref:Uncharacterized protein n=1 Tax=Capsulimonas corticalis TaxID=2219043 RepID=A0A402CNG8_9BACT|nr:hypothetical protein [Capsulimonas corticalis]BDI33343.1 hypothetical protein CCAX7_53940 [Capsulimonas corticalis]